MSWSCPNEIKNGFCGLRKKECNPCSDGCVLANKFKFIGDDADSELDKSVEKRNKKKIKKSGSNK
ncbi:MAG: hypothetical protein QGI05_00550 [Candidatus Omnitrophota bacterium]|jgi:hypothetical protein|nr:hypothetical protein [Candidatus Omnitrophota bacterium]